VNELRTAIAAHLNFLEGTDTVQASDVKLNYRAAEEHQPGDESFEAVVQNGTYTLDKAAIVDAAKYYVTAVLGKKIDPKGKTEIAGRERGGDNLMVVTVPCQLGKKAS
jgi:hypothetical protein